MTSSTRGTPATPENWFDALPVSPTDRIHLRALRGVQVLFLARCVLAELRGESRGPDRVARFLLAAAVGA